MSKSSSDMKLLDHLGELRRRLAVVVTVNVAAAVILFQYAAVLMDYLFAINPGMELVYISPQELLLVYIQLAFLAAIVLCSPVTIYEIWAFVQKGLYKQEKGAVILSLISGLACFAVGAVFCYLVVLPVTLQFFVRISTEEVTAMISVQNYASFINKMLLAFGIVFEMPVLVFLFSKLGYLHPESIRDKRGVLVVLIFVFAALITPPDVVSQLMLAGPMLLLMQLRRKAASGKRPRRPKRREPKPQNRICIPIPERLKRGHLAMGPGTAGSAGNGPALRV